MGSSRDRDAKQLLMTHFNKIVPLFCDAMASMAAPDSLEQGSHQTAITWTPLALKPASASGLIPESVIKISMSET